MKWSGVSATEPKNSLQVSARASDEVFRLLVESVQDYAIFLLSPEGNVMTWNAGAERIKGYSTSEIIGQHFSRFYSREAKESGWPQRELEIASAMGRFADEGWRVTEGRNSVLGLRCHYSIALRFRGIAWLLEGHSRPD